MSDKMAGVALSEELTWDPVRIAQPGPWVGHIPFAFWLVKALRPSCLVELGTHSGNSYFAFCQAINVFCPGSRAYAIDTWKGDDHAGHYDEQIFSDVSRFNRAHFGQFSTLIRSTFDASRAYFPEGCAVSGIDLLHIDGLHSYEAVRHDFDTWRSALSARSVVLFHDTNVRERDFGVWQLWEELRAKYPSFTFDHSNGLGVLGVGPEQEPELRALYGLDQEAAASFRRRFAARGEAFQLQADILALHEKIAAKDRHITDLTGQVKNLAQAGDGKATGLVSGEAGLAVARQNIAWQQDLVATLRELVATKDAMIAVLDNIAAALAVRDRMIGTRMGRRCAMRPSSTNCALKSSRHSRTSSAWQKR